MDYKHQYESMKKMVTMYQDEVVPGLWEKIKELEKQVPKWIPVTERLPGYRGCYIVALKYKYDFEKEFNYDTDVAIFNFGYDCEYIDGQWNTYTDWDEGQQDLHVTHWMPLPEPPKENDNEM